MQRRSQSGLPHIRDGPVDPSLPGSRFVFWLRLNLSSLEGNDLRLKLIVELFQCLLLAGDVFTVLESLAPNRDLTRHVAPSCL